MTPDSITLVQRSIRDLLPEADRAAEAFLQLLLLSSPRWSRMVGSGAGRRGLLAGFVFVVAALEDLDLMHSGLRAVGARCQALGLDAVDRAELAAVLAEVLAEFLGPDWTPELESAWAEVIGEVARIIDATSGNGRAAA